MSTAAPLDAEPSFGASAPHRIRLANETSPLDVAGEALPEGTVIVTGLRAMHLANPFRVVKHCAPDPATGAEGDWAVIDTGRFNHEITHGWTRAGAATVAVREYQRAFDEVYPVGSTVRWIVLDHLRGKDLACTCPEDEPCHGDWLLEQANQPVHAAAIATID